MKPDLLSHKLSPTLRYMGKRLTVVLLLLSTCFCFAQNTATTVDVANLREDLHGLSDKINDLSLRLEQLEAENTKLRNAGPTKTQSYVTQAQLNDALSELKLTNQNGSETNKDEQPSHLTTQLATSTSKKIVNSSDHPSSASHTTTSGNFSDDFPKDGITYVVQRGDTVALIAKKTSSKFKDIINANKLNDPSRIFVGQTLFIPGAK
ncbi:MAG: LysM peptidoglycan-binding domain-containing protein [Verrucomicrobiota bacterium]